MLRVIVSVAGLVIAAGCAVKQPSESGGEQQRAPVQQSAAASKDSDAPKKDGGTIRCREESVTNSRLRKNKVCMTEDAWASRGDKARAAWDEMRSPATGVNQENPTGGN